MAALLALGLNAPISATAQSNATSEYEVKAAFLFRFAQFVDWPAESFKDANTALTYCTIGEDPFGGELDESVKGKTVGNRPLVVQHLKAREQIENCQVLFISAAEKKRQGEYLASASGHAVLTIGETNDFAKQGGMIGFCLENNKIRFEINVEAADHANLKISSRVVAGKNGIQKSRVAAMKILSTNSSIQRQLALLILSASFFALLLASVGLGIYERASFRAGVARELSTLADTLGANTAASLAFDDQQTAREMLGALRAEHNILNACLYDNHGKVFAEYRRADLAQDVQAPSLRTDGAYFAHESLTLFRSVALGNEKPARSRSCPT